MKPVVTVDEMRAIDAAAADDEATLIGRAGWATAVVAREMLGKTYGSRVLVVAGKGNNGADGKVAARWLRERGARVHVVLPGELDDVRGFDLVIDAAYGTGFHGQYVAPRVYDTPVLAVDIPSGVDGDTGVACESAVRADVTVCFAALKPGHLLNDGPSHCGRIEIVDIRLDVVTTALSLIERIDVARALPSRARESHKWKSAAIVVAGSAGMMGAAHLCVESAQRAGAGMVRIGCPGLRPEDIAPSEAVAIDLSNETWDDVVLDESKRGQVLAIGPGIGRSDQTAAAVSRLLETVEIPMVIDADGLYALSNDAGRAALARRKAVTVLTPHDQEFERLFGEKPGADRIAAAKALAAKTKSIVLLKGSTTIVAEPSQRVLLSAAGGSRLATAGTGDVLTGIIAGFIARGADPFEGAACAAFVHGEAAKLGYGDGLIAGDLPALAAEWLSANVDS